MLTQYIAMTTAFLYPTLGSIQTPTLRNTVVYKLPYVQIRECDLLSDGAVFRELHEHDCREKGGIAAGGGDRGNHNNQHAGKLVGMKHRQCAFLPLPDCSRGVLKVSNFREI